MSRSGSRQARPEVSLATRVVRATERARSRGALEPIASDAVTLEHDGIRFAVRVARDRPRKPRAASDAARNPFLPHDPDLHVADLPPAHVCLLNKYPVLEGHLLIVTRDFEEQDQPLGPGDFEALHSCLEEQGGLGFYNAGEAAGASQRHRHLQWVPTPLGAGPEPTPLDVALEDARFDGAVGTAPRLPFLHAFARLRRPSPASRLAVYREMLRAFGLERRPRPYNLLVSPEWMLFVPRVRECWEDVSINALGFAGALLVPGRPALERLRAYGPLRALEHVAVARGTAARRYGSSGP